jgi:hypothetical protein
MNCSNCGNILQPGDKFCTVCGEKTKMIPPVNENAVEQANNGISWGQSPQIDPAFGQQMPGQMPGQQAPMQQMPGVNPNMYMNYNQMQAAPKKGNGLKIAAIAAIAVVVLAGSGFGAYKLFSGSGSSARGNGDDNGGADQPAVLASNDVTNGSSEEPDSPDAPKQTNNAAPIDENSHGTQNRQEGSYIYEVDGALYNDKGSYNLDFEDKNGYFHGVYSKGHDSLTVVDQNALYYINSALDVEVLTADAYTGGISFDGNYAYYVSSYDSGSTDLYIIDLAQKKKTKIDKEVSTYGVVLSANGQYAAYIKYSSSGRSTYLAGLEKEPVLVSAEDCDIYSVTNDGAVIYSTEKDDQEKLFCYENGSNKQIADFSPNKVLTVNDFTKFMFKNSENSLYYYELGMNEATLITEGCENFFDDSNCTKIDYYYIVFDSDSFDGLPFTTESGQTVIFTGADKELVTLQDDKIYDLAYTLKGNGSKYVLLGDSREKLVTYTLNDGKLSSEETALASYIGSFSYDKDLERIWYVSRDEELYLIQGGEAKKIDDEVVYSYGGSTLYDSCTDALYYVKDDTLRYVDAAGNLNNTGCECMELRVYYRLTDAVTFIDPTNVKHAYIGGRDIPMGD